MPLALWTLLWLNFRAFIRRMSRQARSPRGVVFFLIGLCMIGLWIVPSIYTNRRTPPADPKAILSVAPVIILVVCLLNLFTSVGERAVTFTPAEVDFLFPGPFTRRSLLIYKLIKTGLGGIISALILGTVLRRFGGVFIFRFAGIWILFQFMQLLAMMIALVQTIVGERFIAAGRWWIALVLTAAGGLALAEIFRHHHALNFELLSEARQTIAGRVVLAPFVVFARVLVARRFFPDFAGWAAVAAGIDLTMAIAVVALDANYLETSAVASARRYDRLSRVRRSGLSGLARPSAARWKLPMLPWMIGVGPLAWRQLTTVVRTARNLLVILCVVAVIAGVVLSRTSDKTASIGFLVGMTIWLNLFLSQMLKFDFRGDLDQFDVLLSLPIRPMAVATAQLIAPSLVLAVVQLILLLTISIAGVFPWPYVITAALFVLPVTMLTIAADNLMFLLFPFRPATAVAGDMGLIGRQTIVFACRSLLLIIVAGLSAGLGIFMWYLTNGSLPAAAAAAWIPLTAAIAALIWLIGLTFKKFDPSVSTPT